MEIGPDNPRGVVSCVGDVTRQLAVDPLEDGSWGITPTWPVRFLPSPVGMFHVEQILLPVSEVRHGFISMLRLGFGEINRTPHHSWRSASLESSQFQTSFF